MSDPGSAVFDMGQDPLFDPPPDRLPRRLHAQVFGELPVLLARSLDVPEVAAVVRPLLAAGWRPPQLGARVGALPPSEDPVAAVVAFLHGLGQRASPQVAWQHERAERARVAVHVAEVIGAGSPEVDAGTGAGQQKVASEQSRAHWIAEARRSLGLPARHRPVPPPRPAPRCASCRDEGSFFVTREVRLCAGCVSMLGTGRARVAVGA